MRTFTVPSGRRRSCMITPTEPTVKMSSDVGSLVFAFFCAARKISLFLLIASSSAAIDRSRPTKSWETMCGKTMMSRRGKSGRSPRSGAPRALLSLLKNIAAALSGQLGFLRVHDERALVLHDHVLAHHDLLHAGARRDLVHDVEHRALEDGP